MSTQDDIRLAKANEIAANPSLYTICCACSSVMKKPSFRCRVCGNYAFNDDPEHVKATAIKLALDRPRAVQEEDLR